MTKTETRSDPDTLALAASLRLVVMRLARRLRQQADAGISPSMLSALSTIARHGPMTLGALAEAERVQPPTVTAAVGRLEEAGLVSREVDASDRRVTRVALSAEGRRLIERSRSRKTAYLARRLEALSDRDRSALAGAVAVIERILEEPQE